MYLELGLLVLRLVLGSLMIGHGAQKLFGWWGGPGLARFVGITSGHLRFRPSWFWGVLGALSETGGGLLVLVGFLHPLGPSAVVAVMVVAISAHWPVFWATQQGYEYALLTLVVALVLVLTGPGSYSLDAVLRISLPEPMTSIVALGLAIGGATFALITRAATPERYPEPVS